MIRNMSLVCLCGLALASIGCGGTSYETAPVTGQVTCGDKPVPGGQLQFVPVNEDGKEEVPPTSFALIDANGRFSIPNVVVGKHRVAFIRPDAEESDVADDDDDAEAAGEAAADKELAKQLAELPCGNVDDPNIEVVSGENMIDIELSNRRAGGRRSSRDDDDDDDD